MIPYSAIQKGRKEAWLNERLRSVATHLVTFRLIPWCPLFYKQNWKDLKAEALLNERLRSVATHLVTFRLSLGVLYFTNKKEGFKGRSVAEYLGS